MNAAHRLVPVGPAVLVAAALGCRAVAPPPPQPATERGDVVDVLHGVEVADPYRWLEDVDAPETRAWIERENAITEEYLSGIEAREAIRVRLEELSRIERRGLPSRHGDRYYWTWNDGSLDQSVLVRGRTPGEREEVVLDPNEWSDDGTVSLAGTSFSPAGRLLAYAVSDGGSDWRTWRVLDLATLETLDDELRWAKFNSPAWTEDERGFFYGRYPEVHEDELVASTGRMTLRYHVLGTPQSEDALVFEEPEHPRRGFGASVTDDGRWLTLAVWEGAGSRNRLYFRDLHQPDGGFLRVFDELDASYRALGNVGSTFWVLTNADAPNGRIARIDVRAARPRLVDVLPEGEHALEDASLVGSRLVVTTLEDVASRVRVYELDGSPVGAVALPGLGTARGFQGEQDEPETFFSYGDYLTPSEHWRLDVSTLAAARSWAPDVPFDAASYETERVFYASADGTRVPLWVTRARSARRDGDRPTLLYGYGGFNVALRPGFSPAVATWLEMGGMYAVANLRGGSEYGETWHEAGIRERKQNVFDDFVAAAEHLVESGWTRPGRLAIRGGSNGGLLVGAVLNQRPELFGAALPAVGVMDMLRYHRFTIGWAWAGDYGTADEPEMFPVLRAYSPYHNVRPGADYPATLVTTADHDDRVVPGHSFKYTAALRAAQGGDAPILIRVETRAGHGAGKSTTQRIEETADQWAFLARALGIEDDVRLGTGAP